MAKGAWCNCTKLSKFKINHVKKNEVGKNLSYYELTKIQRLIFVVVVNVF